MSPPLDEDPVRSIVGRHDVVAQRWWTAAVAVAFAVGITAWIFTRINAPATGYDWVSLQGFHKNIYREAVLAGHLPLWNPYVAFGRPFLADIETATFYPPNLVFLLPDEWALPLSVGLHVALILIGARWLARLLGLRGPAWWLAGVSFALSAAVGGRLQAGQIQVFCTLAHLPMWLALAIRSWHSGSHWPRLAFSVVTASAVLAGSPPFFWAMAWMLAIWLAAWAVGEPWRETLRGAGWILGWGALGLALAAVQLLPFVELLFEGNRPWHSGEFARLGALPLRNLSSLFVPSTDGFKFNWEMNLFAGVLAPVGLLIGWSARHDRVVRTCACVAVGGLLLALRPPFGVIDWLAPWVPGMGALRLPSRYAIIVGWALVLVALRVWSRREATDRPWILGLAATAQVASLLWAVDAQSSHYAGVPLPEAEATVGIAVQQVASGAAPAPLRVALAGDAVRPNAGVLFGFSNLVAFANPGLSRVWNSVHSLAGIAPRPGDPAQTAELALQPRAALMKWGVQFAWDETQSRFFFDPQAGPRAQAVYATRVVSSAREAARAWWDSPPGVAFLESATAVGGFFDTEMLPQPLRITGYEPESVTVAWESPAAGWLVLAEPWYPGWRASADGQALEVVPANGWMRAVRVPAGDHTVRFEFSPLSLRWGAMISALSLVAVVVGLVFGWRKGRLASSREIQPMPCPHVGFSP